MHKTVLLYALVHTFICNGNVEEKTFVTTFPISELDQEQNSRTHEQQNQVGIKSFTQLIVVYLQIRNADETERGRERESFMMMIRIRGGRKMMIRRVFYD